MLFRKPGWIKNIIYLNPDLRLSKNSSDKNIFLKHRDIRIRHRITGRKTNMKRFVTMAAVSAMISGIAAAEPTGTFRQAHELGFGAQSSLDPISKGRGVPDHRKDHEPSRSPGP